ncbi:hypothetical protein IQ241_21820 [Romeria aff. gracilis LEGE 07310]|uniref:Recombinase family protein n=1 Tax=Vasconcelosia minhoensis LEGE 07310 TaxID=915328 RepID=A0A8J7DN84_9CYAN|nr:hypothetical protein [Romeria gracilis]MBE9079896.1 hypothetical protein [Romeria aff. gracilis LEGE 07310]
MTAWWISGPTRSGKTAELSQRLLQLPDDAGQPFLVFAANGDNRIALANRLVNEIQGRVAYITTTPAGFIQDEVTLFWPLLVEQLGLQAQFPLKLRPENEQLLATQLWQPALADGTLQVEGWRDRETVRHTLDFLQLAALAGIPAEDIAPLLQAGMPPSLGSATLWSALGEALLTWRDWCLARGLLTYGLMTELYWRHLLPLPRYQAQLLERFSGVLADDLDEYPAIAHSLFSVFLAAERPCLFTYNPQGQVRLGLGADPEALAPLAERCERMELSQPATDGLGHTWADTLVAWVRDPLQLPELPDAIALIQTTSRGQLLRQLAEAIITAVHSRQVNPAEVAVIGPGLDPIARYSLAEILTSKGIAVESLNDQRPLISSPLIRALLTLLALIYPGLGRLIDRDAVAEMLVVLSQRPQSGDEAWFELIRIDPVRAELIADYCYVPDIENPHLLPVETFPRWDRLGYQATQAYTDLLQWIESQKQQRQQRFMANAATLLDRAIQQFLWRGNYLPADQLSALRELMETAQYFWRVEERLRLYGGLPQPGQSSKLSDVGRFIQLLQSGAVSANPYPVKPLVAGRQGVTLATVFQYRAQRLTHRWQFWLDAGSPRWLTGKDELLGAPIFLQDWSGRPLTAADIEAAHEERLERILRDLLSRATERIILCHSDLALNGQEQLGPLLSLVSAAQPLQDPIHLPE